MRREVRLREEGMKRRVIEGGSERRKEIRVRAKVVKRRGRNTCERIRERDAAHVKTEETR